MEQILTEEQLKAIRDSFITTNGHVLEWGYEPTFEHIGKGTQKVVFPTKPVIGQESINITQFWGLDEKGTGQLVNDPDRIPKTEDGYLED